MTREDTDDSAGAEQSDTDDHGGDGDCCQTGESEEVGNQGEESADREEEEGRGRRMPRRTNLFGGASVSW